MQCDHMYERICLVKDKDNKDNEVLHETFTIAHNYSTPKGTILRPTKLLSLIWLVSYKIFFVILDRYSFIQTKKTGANLPEKCPTECYLLSQLMEVPQ